MRITKDNIKVRFEKYNNLYFGGILPPCKYSVQRIKRSMFGVYTYSFKNGKLQGHIWIAGDIDWNEDDLQDVIVHEMIHHYVRAIEGRKGGLFGHNWRFRRQCRRIKKQYGLTINIHPTHIYHIGEKIPTNLFQRIRKYVWG